MNFLTRFLKVFLVALVFSALGGFIFYEVVIAGHQLSSGVTPDQFRTTILTVIGGWLGFIIFISLVLALAGMKDTMTVPVYDGDNFVQRVNSAITSLRYRPLSQTANVLIYKPPVIGGVLAEKITVQIGQGTATITAPRNLLKKIQQRL
jgi:hypothetical protein